MYKALKPCTISGKKYIVNETVDVSLCTQKEIDALVKRELITGLPDTIGGELEEKLFEVPVINKDEVFNISITGAQLADVVTILQGTADAAIDAIKNVAAEAPLILIHRLDSRKSVQEAAQKRAEAIASASEGDAE